MPIELTTVTFPEEASDYLVLEWTNPAPPGVGPGFDWDPAVSRVELDWNAGAGDVRILEGGGPVSVAAGWEGDLELAPGYPHAWVRTRVRPVGGWPAGNYGSGDGPLLGRLVRAFAVDAEYGLILETLAPAFDFAIAAPELVPDVPIGPGRHLHLAASCYVTASGVVSRRSWVANVEREGPGVYLVTFLPGYRRSLAEYMPRVTPLAPYARSGALEELAEGLRVRFFDPAGTPADSNFLLAVEGH